MSTSQNPYFGYKYSSLGEAATANCQLTKKRHQQNKEQYNEYQREYQRKLRQQKKTFDQISSNPSYPLVEQVMTNPQLYQQFVSYVNILNDPSSYQNFTNYLNIVNQQHPALQLIIEQENT